MTLRDFARFLSIGVMAFAMGCASGGSKTSAIPEWYTMNDADPDYVVGVGTGNSADLNLAVTSAEAAARAEVARQTEVEVRNLFKRFAEQTGGAEDPVLLQQVSNATKLVTQQTQRMGRIRQKAISDRSGERGTIYTAFVQVELSSSAINDAVGQKIKTEEEMYARFRASQAFQELEASMQ